ncbi:MAG: peptidoglycan DD-metalloendopeptidase family protein [Patescibacteria group bacterium]
MDPKNRLKIGICVASVMVLMVAGVLPILSLAQESGTEAESSSTVPVSSSTVTRDDLANQIQEKAKQLEEINKELEASKQNLKSATGERVTLQKELSGLNGNISQLNLNIKADEITIQKLNLEVESLGYDITDIQASIEDKRAAVEKIMVELQKNDHIGSNLFMVFLKSNSLADGVLEVQALKNLQNQLTVDISGLRDLHDEYNEKIDAASDIKGNVAFHRSNLTNRKLIVQDQKDQRQVLLTETKSKESVFAQQVKELEELQRQIANEVEALDAVLRTKIDPSMLPPLEPGILEIPVLGASKSGVTQDYGATQFAKYGYKGKWHNGIDIGAPIGTPIVAAEAGEIVAVGNQDSYCYHGAYGRYVVIKHDNNLVSLYAHLSRQVVGKGDKVKRGEVIGYAGKTGYATGPHLHFTVFAAPTFYMGPSKVCGPMPYGGDLNPLGYL